MEVRSRRRRGRSGADDPTRAHPAGGQCFELEWTDEEHSWGGGAHPSLVGRSHVIQVTNIGYDVTGDHSFDLQIPGAGQGIFDSGCAVQFPDYASGDFDCDRNYGGCGDATGCDRLPEALQPGCAWRFDDYKYHEPMTSNNPYVRFRRVRCPAELVAISGSTPLDDDSYPEVDLDAYGAPSASPSSGPTAPTAAPTAGPVPRPTPAPTSLPTTDVPIPAPSPQPTPKPSPAPTPIPGNPSAAPVPAPTASAPSLAPTTPQPRPAAGGSKSGGLGDDLLIAVAAGGAVVGVAAAAGAWVVWRCTRPVAKPGNTRVAEEQLAYQLSTRETGLEL